MNKNVLWRMAALAVAILVLGSHAAHAIIIPYSDVTGANYTFVNIAEDTRSAPSALFGPPSGFGDNLDFSPLAFFASANSSTPSDITDGQLNFTVMSANSSTPIDQVMISEAGDYTLVGLGNALATASASGTVFWSVLEVNGIALPTPLSGSASLTMSPGGGSFSLPGDAGTGTWTGDITLDVAAFLTANSVAGKATKVEFSVDNTLTAAAANGGAAFIAKKDFGVTVSVPEPGTFALLAAALSGLLAIARRRG